MGTLKRYNNFNVFFEINQKSYGQQEQAKYAKEPAAKSNLQQALFGTSWAIRMRARFVRDVHCAAVISAGEEERQRKRDMLVYFSAD